VKRARRILIGAITVAASVGGTAWAITATSGGHHAAVARPSATVSAPRPVATSPSPIAPATTTAASTSPAPTPSGVDFSKPESVAAAYVRAAQSLDWHWNSAAGYLPQIKPLSTPTHWTKDLEPLATAPSGAEWLELKAGHVLWTVTPTYVHIIEAAPHGATYCIMRVAFTVLLSGDAEHGRPGGTPENSLINLAMQKVGNRWLVDQTLNGGD
jgi:hypothetical protein